MPASSKIGPLVVAALACAGPVAGQAARETPAARGTAVAFDRDLREVASRVKPALVQVLVSGPNIVSDTVQLASSQRSSGSGVVVDPAGYIVTNAHVVQGARRIQVVLGTPPRPAQGQSVLKAQGRTVGAQLVGLDRETDLAVLRVVEQGLPSLAFGDSEGLHQGQLVLAFGSPLGLDNSMTLGVVSAVARQLKPDDPMIYVQTDASINPGNSGGPLVDLEGRLVGINTLMFTQSGGNEGIGFAAPSNIVKNVFDQIRRTGRVRRSRIGARVQTITPSLAEGLALGRDWGVVVSDVTPGGAADRAGLRIADIVASLDGKPMENARQLEVNLYRREPGQGVSLEVLRGGGKPQPIVVKTEERPDDPARFTPRIDFERDRVQELGFLGLDLDDELLGLLPPLRARAGILVAASLPDAMPTADSLTPGDVIYAVNNHSVANREQLRAAIAQLPGGTAIVLQVERSNELRYVVTQKE